MNIPADLKYTHDHEWVRVEGSTGTIGVTDHAQKELNDIVFVDIDSGLAEITKGSQFGSLEAVKTVGELFAPVSGKVIEVNAALKDKPELINTDPYGEGWMIKVEITDLSDLDSLMDSEAYAKHLGQ
ncbi:MAG: glycine cleavage system protein GcvH [Ignavibacteriaceae bacterium]|nr:glycine cleavage system protein GcvH [Ignavibacteriaceae bacterium]